MLAKTMSITLNKNTKIQKKKYLYIHILVPFCTKGAKTPRGITTTKMLGHPKPKKNKKGNHSYYKIKTVHHYTCNLCPATYTCTV